MTPRQDPATTGLLVEKRGLPGRRSWGQLWTMAASLLFIASCTTGHPQAPTAGGATTQAMPTPSVSVSPTVRPGELTCADAYTTERREGKLTFTASGVGFEALNQTGFDPVPAGNTGLPGDATGYFLKSPVYLEDGVIWAEVTAIKGDITFVWVPVRVWTGSSGWSLATYETSMARFESCNGSYTGFLGAVRTPTAHACVTLGVRSNLHPKPERVRVAIGKGACR